MAYRIAGIEKLWPHILRLPLGTYFDVGSGGLSLEIQADGDKVPPIRAAFPGVWKKIPPPDESPDGWWSYVHTTPDGVSVKIYADRTGPKSCRRIVEEVTETVHVPACEEHDEEVKKTVVRWECPEEADARVG